MRALPQGTVTFLFTDVERSTALLAELGPQAYAEELERHRELLRTACGAYGGLEVDTQGDALFVAFARARDAVAAAREAQRALAAGRVRVRMGLHTGEPLTTPSGYVGMDVHRAARIAAAAHGRQILLSQATRDLVPDVDALDLGEHRLKDLTRPERLYQVGHASFPPPKSLNRTNLPVATHPLVDRAAEQAQLAALLRERRLVTITGPGGTGKTRLALQIAAELVDEFVDGVFFVPLADTPDPAYVVPAATRALGLRDDEPPAGRHALLVLDNLEHLPGAAPELARLLAEAPSLKLLVTSRTRLRVSGEVEVPLDPLDDPAAVELFLDRARDLARPVEPDETVVRICRRLEGLPLALELAAARLTVLGPAALLERLDERLPLLTHGARDLPERHRTLEATIAWSYDLLDPVARRLFARLSVFAGGFDLDAAEAVVDADLDTLDVLVDASLVKAVDDGRFLLLETLREFGVKRLGADEQAELRRRHALHYLDLASRAAPHLSTEDADRWLSRLEADHANLRTALDRLAAEDPALAVRLTSDLWRFWLVRGHLREAEMMLRRALELAQTDSERALVSYQLGSIVTSRRGGDQAAELFERALGLYRAAGDRHGEARALGALGNIAAAAGRVDAAEELYLRVIEILRDLGWTFALGGALGDLAALMLRAGRPREALAAATEAIEHHRAAGNRGGEALALAVQGYALVVLDRDEAIGPLVESARLCRELGYRHGLVYVVNGLGLLACSGGDLEGAARAFGLAQRLRRSIGIECDADDGLVEGARAAVERALGRPCDGGAELGSEADLDAAVAACLDDVASAYEPS